MILPKIIDGNQIQAGKFAGVQGEWKRLITADQTEEGMIVGYGVLRPGENRGWHIHKPGEEEVLYILSGVATAMWREDGVVKTQNMCHGSILYTPAGLDNTLANNGTEDVTTVYFIKTTK